MQELRYRGFTDDTFLVAFKGMLDVISHLNDAEVVYVGDDIEDEFSEDIDDEFSYYCDDDEMSRTLSAGAPASSSS